MLKEVDLSKKLQRQMLVVDLTGQGVNQSDLAKTLNFSRQTLHNYREFYDRFGLEGFVHGYTPSASQSRETQRHLHAAQRRPGDKARELERLRAQARAALPQNAELDLGPPR